MPNPTIAFQLPEQHLSRVEQVANRLRSGIHSDADDNAILSRIFLAGVAAMESATTSQSVISPAAIIQGRRNA